MPAGGAPTRTHLRTTASRLERAPRDGSAAALEELHRAHGDLVRAVLGPAQERGFLGDDPLAAVATLCAPDPALVPLGAAVADLWLAFFAGVRPGEAAAADAGERAAIDAINRRLAALPPGGKPGPALALDLLLQLDALWQRRAQADAPPAGGGEAERLRAEAAAERAAARDTVAAFAAFLAGLRAVAAGGAPPALPAEALAVLEQVRRLHREHAAATARAAGLEARLAEVESRLASLADELAERERRLAALPAEAPADERLARYRAVVAEVAAGRDPAPALERLRAVEQVLRPPSAVLARLQRVAGHHHGALVAVLGDLHAIAPLTAAPSRLRPRHGLLRLGRGGPDLRRPAVLFAVLRDAGLDLAVHAERARWALGVQRLARRVPELRAVFRELVGLLAQWRQRLGEPPPVSQSLPLDGSQAVLALPAVVARDLQAAGRRRGRAVKEGLEPLAPLLEACVGLYRSVLAEARGEPAPAAAAPRREGAAPAVARLAQELAALAAGAEAAFGEAARDGFRLAAADAGLLEAEHLLLAGCQALAAAVEECHALPGAPDPPDGTFPPVPRRGAIDALAVAVRSRAAWLEGLARWRVEPV